MKFTKINMETWKRKEVFERFTSIVPCTFSMTVNLNITNLKSKTEIKNLKLFPSILFLISKIINKRQEFKMNIDDDGSLGYYSIVHPSFTILDKEEEMFSSVAIEYNKDFEIFYRNYIEKNYIEIPKNSFTASSLPWVSFTSFNLNLKKDTNYYPPIFTIGKYFKSGDNLLLPLAIQVHHGVCDGFHVGRFVMELEEEISKF